jgi:hypothetical protein
VGCVCWRWADSIPTVNATCLNATFHADFSYIYSGGGAGNVSIGGSSAAADRGPYDYYPDGDPLFFGAAVLDLDGTNISNIGRFSRSAGGQFGSVIAYYFGGVTITSPDLGPALIIPGTYTFPAVAKGSFLACTPDFGVPGGCVNFEGFLAPDAPIAGKLVVNLEGTATLQVTSLGENTDNPYGVPVDYFTISFAGASTPAPEPTSYGFVLIGGALLAFLGTRARRRADCSAPAIRFSSNGQHRSP